VAAGNVIRSDEWNEGIARGKKENSGSEKNNGDQRRYL
jgi:hypothetical protein